jgi:hypothetical protein
MEPEKAKLVITTVGQQKIGNKENMKISWKKL